MKYKQTLLSHCFKTLLGLILASSAGFAQKTAGSGPINLDKDLNENRTEPSLASSYYHYALAKWNENEGDMRKALSEMQLALQFNPSSSSIHVEIAILMGRTGNISEAMRYAQEAVRLDPQNPDPHWLLTNIYIGFQERRNPTRENLEKAIQELNILKDLTPDDERIYYTLGGAYFEMKEPEKAIQAFEKFQSISKSDAGYREIAKYYEEEGNLEKAIDYLNKGLELQPDSTDNLVALGDLYSKLNKNKDAVSVYKKLLESSNNNPAALKKMAHALIESGAYNEAINAIKEFESKAKPDRTSQLLLGRAYLELRRYPDAISTLQMVLNRIPDDVDALFYLGRAYEENGKLHDAEKIYSLLIKDTAESSHIDQANRTVFKQRLASVCLDLEAYDKAIAIYEEMAQKDPKVNPQLLNAYRLAKRFDQALVLGKSLFEKDPNDIQIGIVYARSLSDSGKIKAGTELLMDLLKTYPENIDIYMNLSEIYRQDKKYRDAEEVLLQGEKQIPNLEARERLQVQRATTYERQQEFDRAESLFKEILKNNPGNAFVLNYVGYMLADRGIKLDEAVRYVKEALKLDPYNGAYLDSLGWAFFKLNDLENAEKYLLEANNLVANDATIDDHLGDFYLKTGDLKKAQEFWERSVQISKEPEDAQKVRQKLEKLQETLRKKNTAK